jgi:hypothetical protein
VFTDFLQLGEDVDCGGVGFFQKSSISESNVEE